MPADPGLAGLTLVGAAAGAAAGVAKPAGELLKGLLEKLLFPSAELAGEHLRKYFEARVLRATAVVNGAVEELNARGIEPVVVPGRILWPILEHASLAEDDVLIQAWTRLLANAADPTVRERVLPSFPSILSELSAREAALVDGLYTGTVGVTVNFPDGKKSHHLRSPKDSPLALEFGHIDYQIIGGNLTRLGLCYIITLPLPGSKDYPTPHVGITKPPDNFMLQLTPLGYALVRACRRD